jgi:hypothetical protein
MDSRAYDGISLSVNTILLYFEGKLFYSSTLALSSSTLMPILASYYINSIKRNNMSGHCFSADHFKSKKLLL